MEDFVKGVNLVLVVDISPKYSLLSLLERKGLIFRGIMFAAEPRSRRFIDVSLRQTRIWVD
jgi:hypothetical protein